jgi:signal recognition particle subunit SRP54
VSEVNQLVDRFFEARKMMMSMASGGGMPGMPGMPGMAGKRSKGRQAPQQKRAKRGSGNPAKRAAQERAASQAPAETADNGAAAFGFGKKADRASELPSEFELPKELKDFL